MTAEQFTYWLQGFLEINDPERISKQETQIIKDHLQLVFNKQTPNKLSSILGNGTSQPYPGPLTTSPYTNPNQVTCGDVSKGLLC